MKTLREKDVVRLSKFMSLVLRHQPEHIGIELDEQGWTDIATLLEKAAHKGVRMDMQTLEQVVDTNSKKRFAFNEDKTRIRASQGHSVEVELGYEAQTPPDVLYHGTPERFVNSILNDGIKKMQRHHVHLSTDIATTMQVGARRGSPVLLRIDAKAMHAAGYNFYCSANGVWLCDEVPAEFISLSEPLSL